jgi:hypothetical protein
VRVDPALSEIAAAGVRAFLAREPGSEQEAFDAAQAALRAEVRRTKQSRAVCLTLAVVLERLQLADVPLAMHPAAAAIGVSSAVVESARGPNLVVLFAIEGRPGTPLECK